MRNMRCAKLPSCGNPELESFGVPISDVYLQAEYKPVRSIMLRLEYYVYLFKGLVANNGNKERW